MVELSYAGERAAPAASPDEDQLLGLLTGLESRINAIESRMFEQEHTLRHTLTMLIESIEDDVHQRHAA